MGSPQFAIAKTFTPLLNTKEWQSVFGAEEMPIDNATGLLREVEAIAFPNTKFIVHQQDDKICEVSTSEYGKRVFVDSRFLLFLNEEPKERHIHLPSQEEILKHLYERASERTPYVLGGNCHRGIPQIQLYYFAQKPEATTPDVILRSLRGVDCSGLLFEATNGYTPRNTAELIHFGEPLEIEGLNEKQISKLVQPLDLIVWKGHVIVVVEDGYCIESRHPVGVVKVDTLERLHEILNTRQPANQFEEDSNFVIRRWIKE